MRRSTSSESWKPSTRSRSFATRSRPRGPIGSCSVANRVGRPRRKPPSALRSTTIRGTRSTAPPLPAFSSTSDGTPRPESCSTSSPRTISRRCTRTTSGSWEWASPARPARSLAMRRRPRRCTSSSARMPVGTRSGSRTGASAPLIATSGCSRPRVASSTTRSATSRQRSRSTRAWEPDPLRPTAGTTWPRYCDSATRRAIAGAPISSMRRRGPRQRSSGWRSPAGSAQPNPPLQPCHPPRRWPRRRSAARANTGRSSSGARPSGFGTPRGCATSRACSVHPGERSTPSSSLSSSHRQPPSRRRRGELPSDGFGDAGPVLDEASKAAYRDQARGAPNRALGGRGLERHRAGRSPSSRAGGPGPRARGGIGDRRPGPPRRLRGGAGPGQCHEGDPSRARAGRGAEPAARRPLRRDDPDRDVLLICPGPAGPDHVESVTTTTIRDRRKICWWRWGRVELPVQNPSPETTTSVSDALSSTARTGIGTLPDGPVTCP